MNRTYRSIWNESLGAWSPHRNTTRHGASRTSRLLPPPCSSRWPHCLRSRTPIRSSQERPTAPSSRCRHVRRAVATLQSAARRPATPMRIRSTDPARIPRSVAVTPPATTTWQRRLTVRSHRSPVPAARQRAFCRLPGCGARPPASSRRPAARCHRARLRRDGQRAEFGRHRRRSRQWHDPAFANSTIASGAGAVAIGSNATKGAQSAASDGIAIGGQSSVASSATSGIAVGRGATVNGAYGIAQGDGVTSGATGQNVAIGSSGTTANSGTAGGGAVAIGRARSQR